MTRFSTTQNALLAVLVVGVISTTMWWFGGFPGFHWPNFGDRQAAARTSNLCPGKVHPVVFDTTWRRLDAINPGFKCRFISSVPDVEQIQFADDRGPFPAGWAERNPHFIRTKWGEVRTYYSLCPLETGSKPVNWDCTPQ